MRRFRYLHDPLFLFSLSAYALNRLVLLPHFGGFLNGHWHALWMFLHSHFDDLLLMPAALPVMLWLQRIVGLRDTDAPPGWLEMAGHLFVWAAISEVVGPRCLHLGVGDIWDVLAFTGGGIAACLWWRRPQIEAGRA